MDDTTHGRLLAEVLLLQRWAGGEAVDAARIFGLLHGFESVLRLESNQGISEAIQDRVEDLLEEIDLGTLPADGMAVKDWLRREGIDETVAAKVMQLCRLQSRFPDVVEKIASARGSGFASLKRPVLPVSNWTGALHYMEIVDATGHKKLHAVFSPCVPRVGETIEPEKGSLMKVVAVNYVVAKDDDDVRAQVTLVPFVHVEPCQNQGR